MVGVCMSSACAAFCSATVVATLNTSSAVTTITPGGLSDALGVPASDISHIEVAPDNSTLQFLFTPSLLKLGLSDGDVAASLLIDGWVDVQVLRKPGTFCV